MWVDVQQGTDEWFNLRIGKITGSNVHKIMAHEGKSFGKPAVSYAEEIAYETITGRECEEESYINENMQRGNELESEAKKEYEYHTFNTVTNGGFFDNGWYGDSPDGLVSNDGCIEIKVVIESVQKKNIKRNSVDPKYKWQLASHLMNSKRDWCDFFTYCPDVQGESRKFLYRYERDIDLENRLLKRMKEFKEVIDNKVHELNAKGIIL